MRRNPILTFKLLGREPNIAIAWALYFRFSIASRGSVRTWECVHVGVCARGSVRTLTALNACARELKMHTHRSLKSVRAEASSSLPLPRTRLGTLRSLRSRSDPRLVRGDPRLIFSAFPFYACAFGVKLPRVRILSFRAYAF